MCGIFGIVRDGRYKTDSLGTCFAELARLSGSRGSDGSGVLSVNFETSQVNRYVSTGPISKLLQSMQYREIDKTFAQWIKENHATALIGHSRLSTNGASFLQENNQPIVRNQFGIVHNGIITNAPKMAVRGGLEADPLSSDTKIFADLLSKLSTNDVLPNEAFTTLVHEISGTASIALTSFSERTVLLYSNHGSLFVYQAEGLLVFASQRNTLIKALRTLNPSIDNSKIDQIIDGSALPLLRFELDFNVSQERSEFRKQEYNSESYPVFENLRRCTKCILPESFPGISFDSDGVCSECNSYDPISLGDIDSFLAGVKESTAGSGRVLVGLSGGRDSCYGLHVLKDELGLDPVAFTYDWGLVTDEARENIANVCGKLKVEHVIVSPDIQQKLRNIRLNINAWLDNPSLAMIPLFMAGDKHFYYYAHKLRAQFDISTFLFCAGNRLETTGFKTRFAQGVNSPSNGVLTQIGLAETLKLGFSYVSEIFRNPKYINRSLGDSLFAFYCSYFLKDDYHYLYHNYPWVEETVNNTLFDEYGWKGAEDTPSTWRIGDGTAAFYNYIYYTVAGFTEHDTFRSNQVREGHLSRAEALARVKLENIPRWDTLRWYASHVGFSLEDALRKIHAMPKLYTVG